MTRLLLWTAGIFWAISLPAQTSLRGKVTEAETGEPVVGGNVVLYKNEVFINGMPTDAEGNYNFSPLDPGTYAVEVSYLGFQTQRVEGVVVLAGKANKLDVTMTSSAITTEVVEVVDYKVPLVEQDNTTSGAVVTSEQIRNLPTRNINALAATTAGLSSVDEGRAITVRGSRADATDYYVDGIRVQGNLVPESEIDQLQVITGGVEARYGDVTGGIISITTKGPSNRFTGGAEMETSSFLDAYNNSLAGLNLSGPLLRNRRGQSVLGFRFAGRYTYRKDDNPAATNVFQIKEDTLRFLEENPIRLVDIPGQPVEQLPEADFLTNNAVNALQFRPNENSERIDATLKIDARLSSAIDISLTGAFSDSENRFTPGGWRVYNSHNNPTNFTNTYRGNFRFRHRIGRTFTGEGSAARGGFFRNATYTLQAGYEYTAADRADARHGDNYFDYGYIGNFDFEWVPVFSIRQDTASGDLFAQHIDYLQLLRQVTYGEANPVWVNYNQNNNVIPGEGLNSNIGSYVLSNVGIGSTVGLGAFNTYNSFVNSNVNSSWGFHTNVGAVYNLVQKAENEILTLNGNMTFDLVPGGRSDRRHQMEVGFMFEKRINRAWVINPFGLWNEARLLANAHILGIPFDEDGNPTTGVIDTLDERIELAPGLELEAPLYDLETAPDPEALFYRRVREEFGVPVNQFINVDGLDPSRLRLDMFAARELENLTDYFGYDYLGNRFDGTFDDFFTSAVFLADSTRVRTFPVAPNRPVYAAAYIQDKFILNDIIFRVGVRVDRYDANTKVLKDPYSLYEIQGAADYHAQFGGNRPAGVGADYKVYLDQNGSSVLAYRDGDNWYDREGIQVNDPRFIFGDNTRVNAVFKDPKAQGNLTYIRDPDFDVDASFERYEPQLNIMPRLAFSFPISASANFYAHYDVLVQRPPSGNLATALDYFNFIELSSSDLIGNPNLRPERTIDYEVGFQQQLSRSSAVKISAYYKEMRDMIQLRSYRFVAGNDAGEYTTYDNQDFGTVKGFSVQYDLRRTGNVQFNANYTLQFADGTGSNPNSQALLIGRGTNLRDLFPLDFDERHRINATLDFRYGAGPRYNGPRIGDLALLSNFGLNLQVIAVSGRPYTRRQPPLELGAGQIIEGAINGSRLPWNFTINARVDKTFPIGRRLFLNVYFRVSNLLDTRNVLDVYKGSGSPTDDGFLATADGQRRLEEVENSSRSLTSYLASYQWALANPGFFSLPRRMFVGAIFDF